MNLFANFGKMELICKKNQRCMLYNVFCAAL